MVAANAMPVMVIASIIKMIELLPHQAEALTKLKSGSILCGGVGSGKSITSLAYYFVNECGGSIKINGQGDFSIMTKPKNLYIITTARKRDSLEWEGECANFLLSTNQKASCCGVKVVIDSWNNIKKYATITDSFFIFDEQRIVGAGTWVKNFLKISNNNHWILLSATPGDVWTDYIPVFVANRFYKNRTEFLRQHSVFDRFAKYPKISYFIGTDKLEKYKYQILVIMPYAKKTVPHHVDIITSFDKDKMEKIVKNRWNIFEDKPVKQASELCYLMRRVTNMDPSRIDEIKKITEKHNRIIVFYNFDYELDILRNFCIKENIPFSEWNGHRHESIPDTETWLYLVQYTAGAEGWNCIATNATAFYSQNYSYKTTVQAAGRIDRLNTKFKDLYYYHLRSKAGIDFAIKKALDSKKDFNIIKFINS